MAIEGQLQLLRQSADAWNQWREANARTRPNLVGVDLSGADLAGRDLRGVDLVGANLRRANLRGADFRVADLGDANFCGADLTGAKIIVASLIGASLVRANLSEANLHGSDLRQANLAWADLSRAKLSDADLSLANLTGANLRGADFHHVVMLATTLAGNDLRNVHGLKTVRHRGPSPISIDTVCRSRGAIPEDFLRGAGVPEDLITSLSEFVRNSPPHHSCLIRYSDPDEEFVRQLCADLQKEKIACWFEREQSNIPHLSGARMGQALRVHDKVLLVISEESIQKPWLSTEVETALEKEQHDKKAMLFPIRLDDAITRLPQGWASRARTHPRMTDFSRWEIPEYYRSAFVRLLFELSNDAEESGVSCEPVPAEPFLVQHMA